MYLGIDPGASGGIACLFDDGTVEAHKMPSTERDVWETLARLERLGLGVAHAYIEQVGPMPSQGVASVFTFGRSYGFLRGVLVASAIPFEEVLPRAWQRIVGATPPKSAKRVKDMTPREKAERKRAQKNRTKALAQQLFPSVKVTHATAEALLIAEACRRVRGNGAEG